jgi:hypothetical protein
MTDTISRRSLLAGTGAAFLTLNDLAHGRLDHNRLAGWVTGVPPIDSPLTLDADPAGMLNENQLGAWPAAGPFEAQSWADGRVMWDGGYSDQPYLVSLPNGVLLSTLTISDGVEGSFDQRAVILRSTDHGVTWTTAVEMESAAAPESSWAMPWRNPNTERLYVFYTYNANDIRFIPNNTGGGGSTRCDAVGVIAYKSTIDGETWTERRHLDLPASPIDLRNPWQGAHRQLWTTGHCVQHGDAVYMGVSKMGTVRLNTPYLDTESFVVKAWETAPGVLAATCSSGIRSTSIVSEEPSPLVFDDGTINVAFRTIAGDQGEAWSTDDGATWTVDWARDRAGKIVPQPRAKAAQFLLPDGRIFLWGHNNNSVPGTNSFGGPRNPVFYRLGERTGPRITWGAPRLLIWDKNPAVTISYPSVLADGDGLLVAATDKRTAKIFRFPLADL